MLKEQKANLQKQLDECDSQQEDLRGIIQAKIDYIDSLEKELARKERKLKIMRIFGYAGTGTSAILAIILILKN